MPKLNSSPTRQYVCANCGTRLTKDTVFAPCRDCASLRALLQREEK